MGMHLCEWCFGPELMPTKCAFSNSSSGDVTLRFSNGHCYVMPDMILHYIHDHGWQPSADFVEDVMHGEYAGGGRAQTKSLQSPIAVGYLSGSFDKGHVPEGFVLKLQELMKRAEADGSRVQYRSASGL